MSNNIFDSLPLKPLPEEIFETLLQNKQFKLERIISTGQSSPENQWYDQHDDEWVILLQGHAILEFKDKRELKLKPGDYVFIKAHHKHRVRWTHPAEICVWLALHISQSPHDSK